MIKLKRFLFVRSILTPTAFAAAFTALAARGEGPVPKPLDVDYYWRTNEYGAGVSGELSDPASWQDGWAPSVPTTNRVYFLANNKYYPQQTDGQSVKVLGEVFVNGRADARDVDAYANFFLSNGSSVLFENLTVGEEARPNDAFVFEATEGSRMLVTNRLLVAGGSSKFSFTGGSVFETTGQTTRFGAESSTLKAADELLFSDSTWLASSVNFGDENNDPAAVSVSMDARNSTLSFDGDVAMFSGDSFLLLNDVTTVAGELRVDHGSTLDVQGGSIVASTVKLGSERGERGSLVLRENAVLETSRVFSQKKDSFGAIELNNGTLRVAPSVASGSSFVDGTSGLDLTIGNGMSGTVDTNGRDVFLGCGVVNERDGTFAKEGVGTLTVTTAISTPKVTVNRGTLHIASAGAISGQTSVGADGTLSLVGSVEKLALKGLELSYGLLEMDPDDCLEIEAGQSALSLVSPRLQLSRLPEANTTKTLISQSGSSSYTSQDAWRQTKLLNSIQFGFKVEFDALYVERNNRTEFRLTYSKVKDTSWTGNGGSLDWNDPDNWSNGVPDKDCVATINLSKPTVISLPVNKISEVWGVAFAGADCVLSNGTLKLLSPAAPISVADDLMVEIKSLLSADSVAKEGKGALVLSGQTSINAGVTVREGRLQAASSLSCPVVLKGGTFEVLESDTTLSELGVAAEAATDAVVVWNEGDVVMTGFAYESGALVKRGKGALSLRVTDGGVLADGDWPLAPGNGDPLTFAPDGSISPSHDAEGKFYYAPLTVAAGELMFQPARSAGATTSVKIRGDVQSGRWAGADESKLPALVSFSSLDVDMSNNVFYAGFGGVGGGLYLGNYSSLVLNEFVGGAWCSSGTVRLALTNSTMDVVQSLRFGSAADGSSGAVRSIITASDSTLVAENGIELRSKVNVDFNASHLDLGARGLVFDPQGSSGRLVFRNGSVLSASGISGLEDVEDFVELAFRGSTWDLSAATESIFLSFGENFTVRSEGNGEMMTVIVPQGVKLQFQKNALCGNGGLAVAGGGQVSFGTGMLRLNAQDADSVVSYQAVDGVLDLSGTGTLARPRLLAGSGQIVGGSFRDAVIRLPAWDGKNVLRINGCIFAGATTIEVDEEKMPPSPFRMKVAEYDGSAPDISSWKFNASGAAGQFVALGGEIFANVSEHGLYIIVK